MVSDADRVEKDYASYRLLVDLWARENSIKTAKLLVLLATNALLIAAVTLAGGFVPKNWPICLAGAAFSLVWILSLGRTALFQERWRLKIRETAARYPEDTRFQVLEAAGEREKAPLIIRVMGAVPSAYYLLGTPVLLCLAWCGMLLSVLI
jgi:hypothetical protein